jgi:short-subunit dehydrogenase
MAVKLKPLDQQVMVITGASSGIGLATALMAAQHGARVVLAARNGEILQDIAEQIRAEGGEATWAEIDVTQSSDLERLARTALETFGTIDTWVNNAGVSIIGRMEQVSEADHRQLFEINFWGAVNGSMVAARHLRQKGGALINVGSVASERSFPLQGMYSATKHALKGFTEAFRMELEEEGAPISVSLIKPTAIATPFMEHVKNYTEHEYQLPPPLYAPEEVAKAILEAATSPQREIYVGTAAKGFAVWNQLAPRSLDKASEAFLFKAQQKDEPARERPNNLYHAMSEGRTRPLDPGYPVQSSIYNKLRRHPILTAGLVAALGLAATALRQTAATMAMHEEREAAGLPDPAEAVHHLPSTVL